MHVRHDAMIRITFTDKITGKILKIDEVRADLVDAHLSVKAWMYGGVSGNVRWTDPSTGRAIRPSYKLELINPDDELKDGQLCDCSNCVPSQREKVSP